MAGEWPLRSYLELGALPTAVPCARLHAKHVVWDWGLVALSETIELLVAELVTNAVAASAGSLTPVGLWLFSGREQVVVLVCDGNPNPPVRKDPDLADEGGRGLLLVEAFSTRWDWYHIPGGTGKVVWATCG